MVGLGWGFMLSASHWAYSWHRMPSPFQMWMHVMAQSRIEGLLRPFVLLRLRKQRNSERGLISAQPCVAICSDIFLVLQVPIIDL